MPFSSNGKSYGIRHRKNHHSGQEFKLGYPLAYIAQFLALFALLRTSRPCCRRCFRFTICHSGELCPGGYGRAPFGCYRCYIFEPALWNGPQSEKSPGTVCRHTKSSQISQNVQGIPRSAFDSRRCADQRPGFFGSTLVKSSNSMGRIRR